MTASYRPLDRTRDRRGVEAIDTTFETSSVFDLVPSARRLELVERALPAPLAKAYSIGEVFAPWGSWTDGWVACDDAGTIRGFIATEHEPWHQRLVIWFLYIAPTWRRRGLGRQLLALAETHGRTAGATHAWLETSNVNVPGITAYEQLGYALCGADTRYYGRYMPGETAIYLAKDL